MKKLLCILLLLAPSAFADELPNPQLTPGDTLPVTLHEICVNGYAGKTRSVGESLKMQVYRAYGMDKPRTGYCSGPHGCEVDHLISLELGGANTFKNLWPQPYDGQHNAHQKDKLENRLHEMICTGKISLQQAQHDIATNWIAAYRQYVGLLP